MADIWRITSTDRQAVEGPADSYVLTNLGTDTVYYGGRSVSSSSNDGSITAGSSVTIAPTKWLISAGQSRVTVAAAPPVPVGSVSGGVKDRGNWAPGTAYAAGDLAFYLGQALVRQIAGTSGATFDATEAAQWRALEHNGTWQPNARVRLGNLRSDNHTGAWVVYRALGNFQTGATFGTGVGESWQPIGADTTELASELSALSADVDANAANIAANTVQIAKMVGVSRYVSSAWEPRPPGALVNIYIGPTAQRSTITDDAAFDMFVSSDGAT